MPSYNYVIDTGTIVAETSDILADVQSEYRASLGQNINVDGSTAQGSLIAGETLARTGVMNNNAEVANQINPNLANGTFLDAVCAFLGITRGSNLSTVGTAVEATGTAATVVAAGSRVQTVNGDIFVVSTQFTLPVSGTLETVEINSQEYGPIPLPVGQLTILDGTIGWGTLNVVASQTQVTLGSTAMLDPALRNYRNQRLASQGTGSSAAIRAAVLAVPNVTSCQVVENNTGTAQAVNGVTFTLPNAMWVCVAGTPDQTQLAMALYEAHQGGCPWDYGSGAGTPVDSPNGVQIQDPIALQNYNVKWTTPTEYDGYVYIQVSQTNTVSDPEASIQNAIVNYATGQEDGELGLVVGAGFSAFEIAGAVARQLPGMYVKNCQVAAVPAGSPAPIYPTGFVYENDMAPWEKVNIASGNIQVVLS